MQTVLITGGAGFIGSNYILYFLEKNKEYKVVNLDLLTYKGNLSNLSEIKNNSRYTFVVGDIRNWDLIEKLFKQYNFNGVIRFLAESYVDNSIKNQDAENVVIFNNKDLNIDWKLGADEIKFS
jgi:dTDP-glucose 4,6-dehydratase